MLYCAYGLEEHVRKSNLPNWSKTKRVIMKDSQDWIRLQLHQGIIIYI